MPPAPEATPRLSSPSTASEDEDEDEAAVREAVAVAAAVTIETVTTSSSALLRAASKDDSVVSGATNGEEEGDGDDDDDDDSISPSFASIASVGIDDDCRMEETVDIDDAAAAGVRGGGGMRRRRRTKIPRRDDAASASTDATAAAEGASVYSRRRVSVEIKTRAEAEALGGGGMADVDGSGVSAGRDILRTMKTTATATSTRGCAVMAAEAAAASPSLPPLLAGTLRRRRRRAGEMSSGGGGGEYREGGGKGRPPPLLSRFNSASSFINSSSPGEAPWNHAVRSVRSDRSHHSAGRQIWEKLALRTSSPSSADTSPDELVRRGAFFLMSLLTCLCSSLFGALYWRLNERTAATLNFGHALLTAALMYAASSELRYHRIVTVQLGATLTIPLAVQMELGGMVRSGGAVLWSFVCPMGAAFFTDRVTAAHWFALYLAMNAFTVLYEFVTPPEDMAVGADSDYDVGGTFGGKDVHGGGAATILSDVQVGYFLLNIAGSMTVVFTAAAYFSSHLEDEFGRSEDLLQNILPRSIAKRLKEGECHIVDHFDGVTILFADLVGFTKASAEMHPRFLVGNFLRDVFSAWDELCQWRGLEKIKTIGDAFMVVGGLAAEKEEEHRQGGTACAEGGGTGSGRRRHHAEEVVLLAFEFQEALEEVNSKYGLDFQVRIGIHSGPVIAGVIGLKKFAFDVWGDAVNTSSRMESHGIPGKIHVSGATYDHVSHLDYLDFERLGPTEIKGKGLMTTYIIGRRSGKGDDDDDRGDDGG